jgi:serine/threonine protein kinase
MTFEDWVSRAMDTADGGPSKQQRIRHKDKLEFNKDTETGAIFLNEYLVIQNIGRGAYGRVRLVMDLKSNRLRAVKMVNKKTLQMRHMYARVGAENNKDPENVMRKEIAVMKKLHHDNVVRLFEVRERRRSFFIIERLRNVRTARRFPFSLVLSLSSLFFN